MTRTSTRTRVPSSRPSLKIGQTRWNLKPLFENDNDLRIEEARKVVEQKSYEFINAWKDRADYMEDPDVLKQALEQYEKWKRNWGTDGAEGYYFWLRTHQDQNDPKLKAKFNKIEEFSKKLENDSQFFYLRIARTNPENQKKFLGHAPLGKYRHFLERIFAESRYHLSEPEEKIMNLKSATSYSNWTKMTSGFLSREERVVVMEDGAKKAIPFSEIVGLLNSKVRTVRNTAAAAFNDILSKHVEVAEAELNSVLQNKKIDDELRGMPRCVRIFCPKRGAKGVDLAQRTGKQLGLQLP